MSLVFPPLYVIIDPVLLKSSELSYAERMAESGVTLLQIRHKHATSRQLFEVSTALSAGLSQFAQTASHSVRFIVNDRADIARLVRAGGVHVGQTDLGVEEARAIVSAENGCGSDCWVGVSTHTLEQVAAADKTSADYIAFGPIFPTVTKEHADPVVGLARLAQARSRTQKPLVAIGGVTLERAAELYRAGADSLAVARDLSVATDPGARARAYLQEAARCTDLFAGGPPLSPGRVRSGGSAQERDSSAGARNSDEHAGPVPRK